VVAAAVTIGGFLFFSGAGSLTAHRVDPQQTRGARFLLGGLVIVGIVVLVGLPYAAALGGGLPLLLRCSFALALLAPLGYLMGFPMPMALARLEVGAPALIPWAWAINGFASVLAPPLAIAMGMTWGFTVAGLSAVALYGAVVAVIGGVGKERGTRDEGRGDSEGAAVIAA
ncbi:MAG: hypothetical protein ACYSXF_05070, partial [Planctomycetota bacterium]|jgi:hypothetical protein